MALRMAIVSRLLAATALSCAEAPSQDEAEQYTRARLSAVLYF